VLVKKIGMIMVVLKLLVLAVKVVAQAVLEHLGKALLVVTVAVE
jgi:hypothetical protein